MKTLEAVRYKQRLDSLFTKISTLKEDFELQAQWARYLCILVSGFLEVSIRATYNQLASSSASPYVANFVRCELDSFQNPKMGKILELTRAFNPLWADKIETATEGELKDAVDSVVANRNHIAHGEDVGITYTTIKNYYEDIVEVVGIVEEMCGL